VATELHWECVAGAYLLHFIADPRCQDPETHRVASLPPRCTSLSACAPQEQGAAAPLVRYYEEVAGAGALLRMALRTLAPTVERWAEDDDAAAAAAAAASVVVSADGSTGAAPPAAVRGVAGPAARTRLAVLGANCAMEMLWW
jgi:hypothetical protein